MKNLNSYIDHTNLKPNATKQDIIKLCEDAYRYEFASVCVNPSYVHFCKELLGDTSVKVCTVIGFPLGQNTTETKVNETITAYNDGADEFDMVINVSKLKDGDYNYVKNEISKIVNAVNGKTVKVIIETGLLTDEEKALATRLSCEAGANFVKTCTGFSTGVATVKDVEIMKANVTNGVKIKASAGIRTREDALALINAGAERLGTSAGAEIIK
ncbi:MAG: deoxyribose-phosphate aldolase [Clostridia bacterium]|nr:deoxyribose-phosphate aldolase [Clostridia bacterium]